MARSLRAFVCYRRDDAFMPDANSERSGIVINLEAALRQLGCSEVFIDTAEIRIGDYFEGRIHQAIAGCDLFVPLIGEEWLRLLDARKEAASADVLVRELETAFRLEKDVVPLLIDGAQMPRADQLPPCIKELAVIDAKAVASDASPETMAATLAGAVEAASSVRRLGRGWVVGYTLIAILVWVLCGILPNAVGLAEFGYDAWVAMAAAWAGSFIWPVFFLPFIMLALYRPLQVLLEATLNADSLGDSLKYASPLILGFLVAFGVTIVEVGPPQAPWTLHPRLHEDCPGLPGPSQASAAYTADLAALSAYGSAGIVPQVYANQFWMKDKCWPNVLFFLTVPLRGGAVDDTYMAERARVQAPFLRLLAKDSNSFKGTEAPYSTLFPFYVLAFFISDLLLSSALLMAMIYATIAIRRPRDGRILRVPSEDAFLSLMYGFITALSWIPFRLTTNGLKFSYYCVDVASGCGPITETFLKDLPFALTLLAAYVAVTVGILWHHKRLLLGSLATVLVCVVVAGTLIFHSYHPTLSQVTGYWQFWLAVSLLANLMLIALWYQFDPAIVRFKDFQRRRRH